MRHNDDLRLALRAGRLARERVVKLPSRNMRAAKSAAVRPHYRATPFKTSERMQDVVVQAQYVMSEGHKWSGHGHYLAREGANREDEQGLGFDGDNEDRDMANTLSDWQSSGDERHWRIMISPEQGSELNLPEYTRQVVTKMEIDLETKLEWVAIDHYNTAHPHVHLLLRGVDDKGRMYWMDDSYVRSGIRGRAKEIATRELGLRTEQDLNRSRERLIDAERFTTIDRAILKKAGNDNTVTYENKIPDSPHTQEKRLQEMGRLQTLAAMGLAEKTGPKTWQLSPDTEKALRQLQTSKDIVKSQAHEHVQNKQRQFVGRVDEIERTRGRT